MIILTEDTWDNDNYERRKYYVIIINLPLFSPGSISRQNHVIIINLPLFSPGGISRQNRIIAMDEESYVVLVESQQSH